MKRLYSLVLTLAASCSLSLLATAQTFTVDWFTLDGGGGAASGGSFALNGTIGQPDAGAPMSGGAFTVAGGFWQGVIDSELRPRLSIRLAGANTIVLWWSNPSTGYVLQQTANMSGPGGGWSDVTQTPAIAGPNKEVMLLATGSVCFFRLRRL